MSAESWGGSPMAQLRGKVLVVDDEAPVQEVLRRYLTQAGYDILLAPNGAAALQLVHSGPPPDLMVLDLMMPVMTGFEVLSALRSNKDWANIPVIVLTATMGYSADHLDVDAMLHKPFDAADVDAAIQAALGSRRKKNGTATKKKTARKKSTKQR
jgi:CheY-like chemotaxis protein